MSTAPEQFERNHWAIHQGIGTCEVCDRVQNAYERIMQEPKHTTGSLAEWNEAKGNLADAVGETAQQGNAPHGFETTVIVSGIPWTVTARPEIERR